MLIHAYQVCIFENVLLNLIVLSIRVRQLFNFLFVELLLLFLDGLTHVYLCDRLLKLLWVYQVRADAHQLLSHKYKEILGRSVHL